MMPMIKSRQSQLGKACAKTLQGSAKISLKVLESEVAAQTPPSTPIGHSQTPESPKRSATVSPVVESAVDKDSHPGEGGKEGTEIHSPASISTTLLSNEPEDWQADEVTQAAKQLAEAFNGVVVTIGDDSALPSVPASETEEADIQDEPPEDESEFDRRVPF
jgi:hypothetical protein